MPHSAAILTFSFRNSRGWRIALALLFGAIAVLYAYLTVFSRSLSLDEGYLMITLQGFSDGNPLYDSVFTQYGPFYYAYEWIVHTLPTIPLTHDATRLLCMFHWLTAASLLGVAAGRLMRSTLGGLFVFVQATVHLSAIAGEPGHPQELVAVLLALAMLVATCNSERSLGFEWLAVIAAALLFTKINVGIFFGLALLLALRLCSNDRFAHGPWLWLLTVVSALLPFVLMRPHLDAPWCRNCGLVAAAAIIASLLVANRFTRRDVLPFQRYSRVALCFLVPVALILGITLGTGTSVHGLIDGLFLTPLRMPGVALLPLPLPNLGLVNAALALALGFAVALPPISERLVRFVQFVKLLYGIAGAFCLLGDPRAQFSYLLPWVWLVLVPAEKAAEGTAGFARLFLCLAATWQSLQAYPIAGTQVTTATFLLVLVYTFCLRDGFQALARGASLHLPRPARNERGEGRGEGLPHAEPGSRPQAEGASSPRPSPLSIGRRARRALAQPFQAQAAGAQALAATVLLFVFALAWCHLPRLAREYASLPPLGLPGSAQVHTDPDVTQMYRALSRYLESQCDTFVTYPGINSLYFWTGKRSPTHLNSTGWGQLSLAQQEQILQAWRKSDRPLLVAVTATVQGWSRYAPPQLSPLIRCVREDCREVKRIGHFVIFAPKSAG